jgi:hypothetical protein
MVHAPVRIVSANCHHQNNDNVFSHCHHLLTSL